MATAVGESRVGNGGGRRKGGQQWEGEGEGADGWN
jgi:hypothetical protein